MADGRGADPAPAPASRRRRSLPIASYLFILALVALVPAFAFSAILLQNTNEAQNQVVSSLTSATTQAIAAAVDRQIEGLATTLKVLSTSQFLADSDLQSFHDRATNALDAGNSFLIVLDKDFSQLINTRVPFGTTLGKTSDLASAQAAVAGGKVTVSNVFFGQTAQSWVYNVLLPLPADAPGPARVLLLTQNAVTLASALSARGLPDGWQVAVLDAKDNVITGSRDAGLKPGEPLPLTYAGTLVDQGQWRDARLGGTDAIAVYWNVSDRGWRVVAWAPKSAVERPILVAFGSLVAGGLLLAILVAFVIYWVSLQIGRSITGLESDARRLGAGQPVEARTFPIEEIETVSNALAEASRRRQASETEVRFLMRELAHRSKNQMTVIAAMAKQTARGAESVQGFVSSFEKRIFGLARSTDLLLAHGVAGVDLKELLVSQVEPFSPIDGSRVTIDGPPLRLNAQAAQILGMAAHELATNAVRYGALAHEGGRLAVSWQLADGRVAFSWRESGARLGTNVHRRGFGTTVLENMVGRSMGAEVERRVREDGIEWAFSIPLGSLDPSNALNGGVRAADGKAAPEK